MASIDRRVRLWAWMVHQNSVAGKTEAEVIAMQARRTPTNGIANRLFGTVLPGTDVHDRTVPGPGGDIKVRVYRPAAADHAQDGLPLIVNFHGGGFVFGDLRISDWICSSAAVTVGAVVVSVNYRLAPVHRFPAAVDDCYSALEWAAQNAAELGAGSPARIGVMGESAGGNLAAVVCLLTRDRGGPQIAHQALIYPPTDLTTMPANAQKTLIIAEPEMVAFQQLYLGEADPADPRVSPLLAGDHGGLPPALIQVAEHDPLRRDGVKYAKALRSAGIAVRFTEYIGMPHGYLNFPGVCRSAPQAMAEICGEQRAALTQHARAADTAR